VPWILEHNESASNIIDALYRDVMSYYCRCTAYVYWWSMSAGSGCLTADVEQQHQQPSASGDVAVPIDDDKRRKNRSAARKCREKRLERQRAMQQEVTDYDAKNERLRTKIAQLSNRVEQLQNLLSEHRVGQCCLMYNSPASSLDTNTTLDF